MVDCDVRMTLHENCVCSCIKADVKSAEAFVRLLPGVAVGSIDTEDLIDHMNASTSSSTMECMRRCMLLCLSLSNKYSGRVFNVDSGAVHDCGRKMCTCSRLVAMRVLMAGLRGSMSSAVEWRAVDVMLKSILASRGTLKWWSGSKRMTAAFWPGSGAEENDGGRMAWAMIR